jgi:A/G-specific adenine glycosylase
MNSARADFAPRLLAWYDAHGRKDLPWQTPRTPYRVWISEIMLQQTQVATVIPYFERFVRELPDLAALAGASLDRVLALWSGLGYYTRARNLHAAARACMQWHGGELPATVEGLAALPGVGRSTAGAILAQAHGARAAILDGNVRRVLARWRGIDADLTTASAQKKLWVLAESLLPDARLADYTQAQMDLGATVCTRRNPRCTECPLHEDCIAQRDGRTAELPRAKKARALPQREAWLLLLRDADDRVLLVRRPPAGIWGGLWSLPQAADRDGAMREGARRCDAALLVDGDGFMHTFSHFRLRARILEGKIDGARNGIAEDAAQWVGMAELGAFGLPQPIRRLLSPS